MVQCGVVFWLVGYQVEQEDWVFCLGDKFCYLVDGIIWCGVYLWGFVGWQYFVVDWVIDYILWQVNECVVWLVLFGGVEGVGDYFCQCIWCCYFDGVFGYWVEYCYCIYILMDLFGFIGVFYCVVQGYYWVVFVVCGGYVGDQVRIIWIGGDQCYVCFVGNMFDGGGYKCGVGFVVYWNNVN